MSLLCGCLKSPCVAATSFSVGPGMKKTWSRAAADPVMCDMSEKSISVAINTEIWVPYVVAA